MTIQEMAQQLFDSRNYPDGLEQSVLDCHLGCAVLIIQRKVSEIYYSLLGKRRDLEPWQVWDVAAEKFERDGFPQLLESP